MEGGGVLGSTIGHRMCVCFSIHSSLSVNTRIIPGRLNKFLFAGKTNGIFSAKHLF